MSRGVLRILPRLNDRLNGWQRAGIILSILWALGAGIYTHNADVESADNYAKFVTSDKCLYSKSVHSDKALSNCDQRREESSRLWLKDSNSNGNAAFAALAPIPFGWLAGFILFYVIRVQVVGFRAIVPWAPLNWRKKSFVVLCALVSFLVILFGITVILNLYVDTQVPVTLSPFKDVVKSGEDFVTAEGTWTRTDLTDDTIVNPLQTSKIECRKQEHRCVETRASVSGNTLITDLIVYDVESWTPASIIFRNDMPCTTEVFTIDLNTELVSGAGHLIDDSTSCKNPLSAGPQHWNYLLSNGTKVYWEERKKARPLPLRLIQSLFGN